MSTLVYPGYRGSVLDQAAERFDASATRAPLAGPEAVIDAVAAARADIGVVAVSTPAGILVTTALDRIVDAGLVILGEIVVPATVALMVPRDERGGWPRLVASPLATASRCGRFFRDHPDVLLQVTTQLEGWLAAQEASGVGGYGVLAPASAADAFGLTVLVDAVDDDPDAALTCAAIGRPETRDTLHLPPPTTTLVAFAVPNESGALHRALSVFAIRDVDITSLTLRRESTSHPRAATFYATLNVAASDPKCVRALEHLREQTSEVRVLGTFATTADAPHARAHVAQGFEWDLPESRADL
ncbi:MAG: prephenate dehydratase domain-containing protein [Vicinamibacterales bacterium]